ncbi:MAG: PspC domain-containing protein [Acidimicrobiales bacterium]|jgi:phage shock protein PspC (stress-responsive transcriptional regulator)
MDITTDHKDPTEQGLLRRSRDGAMLAGVAAGLADYFDVDVTLVRIGLVALTLLGGAGVPLYVAAWLLIPEEGSEVAIAGEILNHSWHR